MQNTPEQIAALGYCAEMREWLFSVCARDIAQFMFLKAHSNATDFELGKAAFNLRVSYDAAAASDKLTVETNKLVGQVIELVGIAAEQKRLAAKLDAQTDTIISLTRWLRGLTIALVVLAVPLFLEALHFIKASENSLQICPHMQQTNQPTQKNTNQ